MYSVHYALYIQNIPTRIKRAYLELCLRPGTDGGDALSISLLRITKINLGTWNIAITSFS